MNRATKEFSVLSLPWWSLKIQLGNQNLGVRKEPKRQDNVI